MTAQSDAIIISPRGIVQWMHRYGSKRQHVWYPGVPMTGDGRHEYGVHAFKNQFLLDQYFHHTRLNEMMLQIDYLYFQENAPKRNPQRTVFATGTIAMWGEVIEHERGYRAEFAKVHSINSIDGVEGDEATAMLADLRNRYGV